MRVVIKPEFQIQRINQLENALDALKSVSKEALTRRPTPKNWAAMEVIQHMIIAHEVYSGKVKGRLIKNGVQPIESQRTAAVPSFLIKRFPPRDGQIRFKMKTMKRFEPLLEVAQLSETEIQQLLDRMKETLHELRFWVDEYRNGDVSLQKFNSAIGAMVRFNVPEACEFILCHNERHFQQIQHALRS